MRYSFPYPSQTGESSSTTYSRITESRGGVLVPQEIGRTTVQTTGPGLILPAAGIKEIHLKLPEYNDGKSTLISWPCSNEIVTANDLHELVLKATAVWRKLLTNRVVAAASTEFYELRKSEEGAPIAGISDESTTGTFQSFVANADEMEAMEQITSLFIPPQPIEPSGSYGFYI